MVPGRGLLISASWQKDESINILNIYSPNKPTENRAFWEEIHDSIIHIPQPDVILGDFNFVKDPMDRLPAIYDNQNTIEAWCSLKSHLTLSDGWRACFPRSLKYCFSQTPGQGGHQSHIDRIYVKNEMIPF
ncbi:hypothetical protein ID866_11003 [Astraeus odoratus]|nr:hypothetical protein ID866_11003 [Astraeus odoratus]